MTVLVIYIIKDALRRNTTHYFQHTISGQALVEHLKTTLEIADTDDQ